MPPLAKFRGIRGTGGRAAGSGCGQMWGGDDIAVRLDSCGVVMQPSVLCGNIYGTAESDGRESELVELRCGLRIGCGIMMKTWGQDAKLRFWRVV